MWLCVWHKDVCVYACVIGCVQSVFADGVFLMDHSCGGISIDGSKRGIVCESCLHA